MCMHFLQIEATIKNSEFLLSQKQNLPLQYLLRYTFGQITIKFVMSHFISFIY